MFNKPTIKQLSKIPKLGQQENNKDPKVYMKFFFGPMTWYVMEFDGKDTFFGYVINDYMPENAELGYFSLRELMSLRKNYLEVDREIHGITPYTPKKFSEVKKIHYQQHYNIRRGY